MAESAQSKARRYLTEGRLTVLACSQDEVQAECKGQGAIYKLGYRNTAWYCNCPAYSSCSHLQALMQVVVREYPS